VQALMIYLPQFRILPAANTNPMRCSADVWTQGLRI
jgi:hypothetical protein